jgi:hypothetical protein
VLHFIDAEYKAQTNNSTTMKLKSILFILLLSPLFLTAQNLPACDSVFIDCCTFNSPDENTLSILVSNYSSDIFSYPGFILFNESMDTMAIETINYFGIGWSQTHILNIINPFNLPFEGILELHTGFYEMQACTFPITIPDTTLSHINNSEQSVFKIYPNPVTETLTVASLVPYQINQIRITDLNGCIVKKLNNPGTNVIDVADLKAGFYFIHIVENGQDAVQTSFIKQ